MKHFLFYTAFISLLLSFAACSNDSSESPVVLSYFRGLENDTTVCIEQYVDYDKCISPRGSVYNMEDLTQVLSYQCLFQLEKGNGYGNMDMLLAPLQTGVYKIQSVENPLYDRKESHLILRADHKTYQPGTSPFTVIVEEIDPTLEIHFPHITGKMEGTLYNTENPRDSITFKKVEFRIW